MNNFRSDSIYLQPVDDGLPASVWGRWSKTDKLNVLARYIHTSTIATSGSRSHWRRRFYIDLQAGPGKSYIRGQADNIFLGSPLLALTTGVGYTDYRFVEKKEFKAEALKQRCQTYPFFSERIKIFTGDCNVMVDEIVAEIRDIDRIPYTPNYWNCLTLAFLDPTGLELHWETVYKLALLKRTDILINFSINGLRRNARSALKNPHSAISEKVDGFLGSREWRQIDYKPSGLTPAYEWIEFYKKNLTRLGYLWGTHHTVKNSQGGELYRLLFASKDQLGIKFWEDARTRGPEQMSLF